ncbi:MAG: hypothetical protein ACFCVB_05720 [Nodosilinea sp.]
MIPRLAPSFFPLRRLLSPRRKAARSWLGVLCVAASLGAHGVLLALMMPGQESDLQPPEPPAETLPPPNDVAVTVLPRPEDVAPPPEAAIAPTTAVAPPAPPAPVAPAAAPPEVVTPPEVVAPPNSPAAPAPPAPPPPATVLEPDPPAPFADFPHLDGAQATCPGLATCWRSPVSSSWRTAANDLQDRLEAQGYRLSNVTGEVLAIDSGVTVYAVSKAGEPDYFLNLISVSDGVLYTMTPEPMTTEQVLTLQRS